MTEAKETVPAEAKYYPKRSSLWVLTIEGFDSFLFKECSRPSVSVSENKKTYQSMSVVMTDAIQQSGAMQAQNWLDTCELPRSGLLTLLNAMGEKVETWTFPELKLEYVSFGDLSYENSSPTEIRMLIRPSEKGYEYWSI